MKITAKFYLDYVNNYLTIPKFAADYKVSEDAHSLISRSKVALLSELSRDFVYKDTSSVNNEFHKQRFNNRLLSEFSA